MQNLNIVGGLGNLDRLSEEKELVSSILSQIDLKILYRCLLVSKSFASAIYRIQTATLTLPAITMDANGMPHNLTTSFKYMYCQEIPKFIQSSSSKKLKLCGTLKKFRDLKSIHVEFTYPVNSRYSSLLKWEAKFRGAMVESLACILPFSISNTTKRGSIVDLDRCERSPSEFFYMFAISCCREWLMVMYLLISCHHTLKSVTITDSFKHGKLVMGEHQLAECRTNLLSSKCFLNTINPTVVSYGTMRDLHLQVSGNQMKHLIFVFMDFLAGSNTGTQMSWEYETEEKELEEAIRIISSKIRHRDPHHTTTYVCSNSEFKASNWGDIS